MRLSLLLLLFAAEVSAETLTFQNVLTIVPCSGYTLTHYADGILQYRCPSGFKINWPCAHPSITTPSAGVRAVTC
jgi:hypothetical protein